MISYFFMWLMAKKVVWFICLDRSRGYQANRPHSTSSLSNGTTTPARSSDAMATSDHHNFKSFLWQHISLALTKGFDDNVGRNPAPQVFEVGVLLGTWEGEGCHCSRRALPIFFSWDYKFTYDVPIWMLQGPWTLVQYKDHLSMYRDSHLNDKTVETVLPL